MNSIILSFVVLLFSPAPLLNVRDIKGLITYVPCFNTRVNVGWRVNSGQSLKKVGSDVWEDG